MSDQHWLNQLQGIQIEEKKKWLNQQLISTLLLELKEAGLICEEVLKQVKTKIATGQVKLTKFHVLESLKYGRCCSNCTQALSMMRNLDLQTLEDLLILINASHYSDDDSLEFDKPVSPKQ